MVINPVTIKFISLTMLIVIVYAIFCGLANNYPYSKIVFHALLSLYGLHCFSAFLSKTKMYLAHTIINENDSVELRFICAVSGLSIYFYFTLELIQ